MDRELPADQRRRRRLLLILRAVLGIAVAAALLGWLTGILKPTLKRARMRTARVERGPLEAVLTASGTVQPANEEVISSPIEARILRVLRQPGAVVEAGEALLELDASQPRLELQGLDETIRQTEDRRRKLELDLGGDLNDLRRRQELKRLDAEQLDYQLRQSRQLFEQGLTSELVLRQIETRVKKAGIELDGLEEAITSAVESQQAQLRSVASELRSLRQEREEARRRLERATPRAERPGVVTWVADEEGATVRAGEALARLAEPDSFRVEARISDVHASRVRTGQPVRVPVTNATLDDVVLDGVVDRVLPAIDNGVVRFRVALDEPGHELLHNRLRVDVLVVIERRDDVLTIRKGPFANSTGPQEVFVVRGDAARRRAVRLGLSGHRDFEVVEGLVEGEEVVISDVDRVRHLEEVEVE